MLPLVTACRRQVWIGDHWYTSQRGTLGADLGYVLPLTHGQDVPGDHRYRVVVTTSTGTHVDEFTFTRFVPVTVTSVGTKPVGQTTFAWGSVREGSAGDQVQVQARVDGRWVTSRAGVLDTNGGYLLQLTYGMNTPGNYRYRVVSVTDSGVQVSREFTLTRV